MLAEGDSYCFSAVDGTELVEDSVEMLLEQHGGLAVRRSKNFHDRFLVIDNKTLYVFGASLKDLGGKCFAFTKLDSAEIPNLRARM